MKRIHATFALIILITLSTYALASSLSVNPVLLTFSNEDPVSTLTLANASDNKVTIQADVFRWLQKNGIDVSLHTSDMIISPPLFQIDAHQSQLIRIAWLTKRPIDKQLTYRVILREIVPKKIINENLHDEELRIALAFSIPLFVQPTKQAPSFRWLAKWNGNNKLKLDLQNPGNMTLFVNKIQLRSGNAVLMNKETFTYILPQQYHSFVLNLRKRDALNISAMINGEWKVNSVHIKD